MAQDYSGRSSSIGHPDADAPAAPSRAAGAVGAPFGEAFAKMRRDMNFVGLFTVIYGALSCLTIIGALVGIPYIIMGLRLRSAADAFDDFDARGDRDALRRAFEKQRSYFFINKVLIIIGLVFFALYIAFIVFAFSVGFFTQPGGGGLAA